MGKFTAPDNVTLQIPLGKWTANHSKYGTWSAYINTKNKEIYVKESHTWNTYINRGSQLFLKTRNVNYKPLQEHLPITVEMLSNGKQYCNFLATSGFVKPKQLGPAIDWESMLNLQPGWIQKLMGRIRYSHISDIVDYIAKEEYLIVVSDGSVRQNHMTFGWLLSTPAGTRIAEGSGPCNGRPSSLRSEAAGMLSASLFIAMIQEFTQFSFNKIKMVFAADNKSLIDRQNQHKQYTTPYSNATLAAEFDLTEEIYQTHQRYRIASSFIHVKGHQDDHIEFEKLPLMAQLNVEADELASLFYTEGPLSELRVVPL